MEAPQTRPAPHVPSSSRSFRPCPHVRLHPYLSLHPPPLPPPAPPTSPPPSSSASASTSIAAFGTLSALTATLAAPRLPSPPLTLRLLTSVSTFITSTGTSSALTTTRSMPRLPSPPPTLRLLTSILSGAHPTALTTTHATPRLPSLPETLRLLASVSTSITTTGTSSTLTATCATPRLPSPLPTLPLLAAATSDTTNQLGHLPHCRHHYSLRSAFYAVASLAFCALNTTSFSRLRRLCQLGLICCHHQPPSPSSLDAV